MTEAADTTNPSTIHDIPPGTPPGGGAPAFEAVGGSQPHARPRLRPDASRAARGFTPLVKPEFVMAYPPTHLMRSPEQRLLDLNARYDRVRQFDDASWDAYDGEQDKTKRENAETANKHALRMLREIRAEAYIIPARSILAIALKARIMSDAKKTWWDHESSDEDADARVLIEDILALAGMDRIHQRSFEFSDLLPGYDGPKLFEGATTDIATPLLIRSTAPTRSSSFWTEVVGPRPGSGANPVLQALVEEFEARLAEANALTAAAVGVDCDAVPGWSLLAGRLDEITTAMSEIRPESMADVLLASRFLLPPWIQEDHETAAALGFNLAEDLLRLYGDRAAFPAPTEVAA